MLKKVVFTVMMFGFSMTISAELVTPDEHMEWHKNTVSKCNEIKNMGKSLRCMSDVHKARTAEGLHRGTSEYVEKQYAALTGKEIQKQIELAEEAAKTAETVYYGTEPGELTRDDYLIEITAAKRLLHQRRLKQSEDNKQQH